MAAYDPTPNLLRPDYGSNYYRPPGLQSGDFPLQSKVTLFKNRAQVISGNTALLQATFGAVVGAYCHIEVTNYFWATLAVHCDGDPDAPNDTSLIQASNNAQLPSVGDATPYLWFDWVRFSLASACGFNQSTVTRTYNRYVGEETRGAITRVIQVPFASTPTLNGGTARVNIGTWTLDAPGNATVTGLDCPLISEDGTTPAPLPLRIPCWVGRWGFKGGTGQSITATTSDPMKTQAMAYFLKLPTKVNPFVANVPARKIELQVFDSDFGCEFTGTCGYAMDFYEAPAVYYDTIAGPACRAQETMCARTKQLSASIRVVLVPIGNTWMAVMTVLQMTKTQTVTGLHFKYYNNFVGAYAVEMSAPVVTQPAPITSATPIAFGTTTTLNQALFASSAGEATATLTVTVSPTGKITTCEVAVTPQVSVSNLGPGWHDGFVGGP